MNTLFSNFRSLRAVTALCAALLLSSISFAQAPQRINYQAVARDNTGAVMASQPVSFRLSILENSSSGNSVYSETHNVTTNGFGLANLQIGGGSVLSGTFSAIAWGGDLHFIQVELDAAGGSNYQLMGTSQLVSVPYALHANTVENDLVDDADADPTNENQDLTLTGNTLAISNGNSVTLGDEDPTNENQDLTLTGNTLAISNGNTVTLGDEDPTNEFQTLSLLGSDLTLTNGNTVTLASGGNTLDEAYDQGGPGAGAAINADAGAVVISTAGASAIALDVDNTNTGVGITANTTNAANTFSAIQASTNSSSTAASAIIGNSDGAAWGVSGQAGAGSTAQAAVYGSNLRTTGGHGVLGIGFNGVVGETNQSTGNAVYGENYDAVLPLGNGVGTAGKGYYGVVGEDRYLGGVAGAYGVFSNGNLAATGTKTFVIDHPADPENKFLKHFSMESNEVLNLYRGNASFDANGEAVVALPDYFEAINTNFSYNLTPVGGFAQLFVKEKIADNQFTIGGGQAGLEVSWTVYAERNDEYLQQYPEQRETEVAKREGQVGKYLMPALYGASEDLGIFYMPGGAPVQPELNIAK
jgi:hypothetical protein